MNLLSNFYYNVWKKRKVKGQLFQTGSNCYVYACLNALRYKHPVFKKMSLKRIEMIIKEVEGEIGNSKSISKVLNVLIDFGYIKSYSKEKSRLVHFLKQLDCAVISQKRVLGLPKTKVKRWNAIIERIKNGKGITSHAVAFRRYSRVFGLQCINSHKTLPQYAIKDLNEVQAIYKIEL